MEEFYKNLLDSENPLMALDNAKEVIKNLSYNDLESKGFNDEVLLLGIEA